MAKMDTLEVLPHLNLLVFFPPLCVSPFVCLLDFKGDVMIPRKQPDLDRSCYVAHSTGRQLMLRQLRGSGFEGQLTPLKGRHLICQGLCDRKCGRKI